jgi:hypothetical protein
MVTLRSFPLQKGSYTYDVLLLPFGDLGAPETRILDGMALRQFSRQMGQMGG